MAAKTGAWIGAALIVLAACSDEEAGGSGGGTTATASGGGGQTTGGSGGQASGGSGGQSIGGAGGAGGQSCTGFNIVNSNVGFESGTFLDEWHLSSNNGEDCAISVVTSPTRSGDYSLHVTHSIQGSGNYNRCEFGSNEMFDPNAALAGRFNWHTEYWLGYSIYLEDWTTDPADWNVLGQTHAVPGDYDWNCCSGPQFWEVSTHFDQFRVGYGDIPDPEDPEMPCSGDYTYWTSPVGPMQNRWIDIVIHFNATVGTGGFVHVWVDGIQRVDQHDSVLWALDTCGEPRTEELILQMGSYKEPANTTVRSVYYDEIRITGADGCYDAVAPRD
ncbi:MAG: heparin lyase I family protein [Deltaproteobacteria bacterium]|jgi:hypothetical protein|nr:heparin lyase I family protein [Deltaproteobacteria bacterium]MBW2532808.1 heparin lyase I family protein [Deltaproteobacteria bacterium]